MRIFKCSGSSVSILNHCVNNPSALLCYFHQISLTRQDDRESTQYYRSHSNFQRLVKWKILSGSTAWGCLWCWQASRWRGRDEVIKRYKRRRKKKLSQWMLIRYEGHVIMCSKQFDYSALCYWLLWNLTCNIAASEAPPLTRPQPQTPWWLWVGVAGCTAKHS